MNGRFEWICNQNSDKPNVTAYCRRLCCWLVYECVCAFFLVHFIDGHERESRVPSKNHQSTFTTIMADTRTRNPQNLCRHHGPAQWMTKAIVYLCLNYIFILSLFFVGSLAGEILHHFRHNCRKCKWNETNVWMFGPSKMVHRHIKGFSRNHSRKLFAALLWQFFFSLCTIGLLVTMAIFQNVSFVPLSFKIIHDSCSFFICYYSIIKPRVNNFETKKNKRKWWIQKTNIRII